MPSSTGAAIGNDHPSSGGAWRSGSAWAFLAITIAIALVVDLASKDIAFRYVAAHPVVVRRERVLEVSRTYGPEAISQEIVGKSEPLVVIPDLLHFTLVLNPGAVFGMGAGQRGFFVAFTLGALAFGVYMFGSWTRTKDHWAHIAIGLLLGGGLGNLYDRLAYACVRDFIHPLPGWTWPGGRRVFNEAAIWPYVSNLADLFLLVGIVMLLGYLWRRDRQQTR